jgi:hypothetical protein
MAKPETAHPPYKRAFETVNGKPAGWWISDRGLAELLSAALGTDRFSFEMIALRKMLLEHDGTCLTRKRNENGTPGYAVATEEEKVAIHMRRKLNRIGSEISGLHLIGARVETGELSEQRRKQLEFYEQRTAFLSSAHAMSANQKLLRKARISTKVLPEG